LTSARSCTCCTTTSTTPTSSAVSSPCVSRMCQIRIMVWQRNVTVSWMWMQRCIISDSSALLNNKLPPGAVPAVPVLQPHHLFAGEQHIDYCCMPHVSWV
jgi:hypothetical protein